MPVVGLRGGATKKKKKLTAWHSRSNEAQITKAEKALKLNSKKKKSTMISLISPKLFAKININGDKQFFKKKNSSTSILKKKIMKID